MCLVSGIVYSIRFVYVQKPHSASSNGLLVCVSVAGVEGVAHVQKLARERSDFWHSICKSQGGQGTIPTSTEN